MSDTVQVEKSFTIGETSVPGTFKISLHPDRQSLDSALAEAQPKTRVLRRSDAFLLSGRIAQEGEKRHRGSTRHRTSS